MAVKTFQHEPPASHFNESKNHGNRHVYSHAGPAAVWPGRHRMVSACSSRHRHFWGIQPEAGHAARRRLGNAGFSKYLSPFKRGVIQSPDASISWGIAAYRPSSGWNSSRSSSNPNQITRKRQARPMRAKRGIFIIAFPSCCPCSLLCVIAFFNRGLRRNAHDYPCK